MTDSTGVVAAVTGVEEIPRNEFEDVIRFLEGRKVTRVVRRNYLAKPFSRTVFLDFPPTAERYLIFRRSEALLITDHQGRPPGDFLLAITNSSEATRRCIIR